MSPTWVTWSIRGTRTASPATRSTRERRSRSEAPEPVRQPEPPDDPERLDPDPLGQLRLPPDPVLENEGHLPDPQGALPGAERRLDLEGVPVRAHALGFDGEQRGTAPALETARRVADRHRRERP